MTASPSPALHAAYGAIAMALLTLMDAFIKAASVQFSAVQILWLRFALTAIIAALLLKLWRTPWPTRKTLPQHLVRALLMIVSNGTFIYALGALPLAEVFALALTAPLFLAALGALALQEKMTAQTMLGLVVGFVGTLIIVFGDRLFGSMFAAAAPLPGRPPLALLAALTSPVTYAVSLALLRQQATGEAPVQVVFIQALLVAVLVTPALAVSTWSPMQIPYWPTLLAIGATSTAGYLILVKAPGTAVRYSVIEYTGLVWAALIGWLWFAEQPTAALMIGAGCIVIGAMITVLQREAAKTATT